VWSGDLAGTDPNGDTLAHVDVSSGLIPTAILGVTARPHERIAVGASWRRAFTFDASGTLTTDLAPSAQVAGGHQTGTEAGFSLPFPAVFRVGVLARPRERWLVELDFVYERWSALRSFALEPHGIVVSSDVFQTSKPLPNIVFQKNFDDAFSVRLGAE